MDYNGNRKKLNHDDLDYSKIARTSEGAKNGNYVNVVEEYFGDDGDLSYEVKDDGSVLIYEGDTAMGWTTEEAINTISTPSEITEMDLHFDAWDTEHKYGYLYDEDGKLHHYEKQTVYFEEGSNNKIDESALKFDAWDTEHEYGYMRDGAGTIHYYKRKSFYSEVIPDTEAKANLSSENGSESLM